MYAGPPLCMRAFVWVVCGVWVYVGSSWFCGFMGVVCCCYAGLCGVGGHGAICGGLWDDLWGLWWFVGWHVSAHVSAHDFLDRDLTMC